MLRRQMAISLPVNSLFLFRNPGDSTAKTWADCVLLLLLHSIDIWRVIAWIIAEIITDHTEYNCGKFCSLHFIERTKLIWYVGRECVIYSNYQICRMFWVHCNKVYLFIDCCILGERPPFVQARCTCFFFAWLQSSYYTAQIAFAAPMLAIACSDQCRDPTQREHTCPVWPHFYQFPCSKQPNRT